jgi:hypothetical protein
VIATQLNETADFVVPAGLNGSDTVRVELGEGLDAVLAIKKALEKCRLPGKRRLVLPPGTHHLYPDFAHEKYLFISNNDEGLKRVAFFLEDLMDLELDGQGCLLMCHGFILPFVISQSSRITVRNLRIDWERAFHSETCVVGKGEGYLDLKIPPQYPYRVEGGKLLLIGEGDFVQKITNALEFDTKRRETAFKVRDNYNIGEQHRAEEISPGTVRLFAKFSDPAPQIGNVFVLIDEDRHCPAVTIMRCSDILLEEVSLHHAGGMGVIAQLSSDVTLRSCVVAPRPETGRMISLRADATHFVCCRGQILLEDCEFSHQLDDPGNFHNVFTPIVRRLSDRSVIVRLEHFQQKGLEPYEAGHLVEFIQASSLVQEDGCEISRAEVLNKDHALLEFEEALPEHYQPGWAVGSLHWVADVTVRRTKVHSNRARGFLVTSSGKAVFEDNHFHTPGAAILVEGDANCWYEAGAVTDLVVRNNVFENCNYGVWGRAVIDINPKISAEHKPGRRFHRNIRVEGNEFLTFHPDVLRADCVDGLVFRDNTIRFTAEYDGGGAREPRIVTEHCSHVDIAENTVINPR